MRFEESGALLFAHGDAVQRAHTLISQAEAEHRWGDAVAARGALEKAAEIAAGLNVPPTSTLGRALAAARGEISPTGQ